jgi:hypothetical protein
MNIRIFKSLDHATGGQPVRKGDWKDSASRIILKAMEDGDGALSVCQDCEDLKSLISEVIERSNGDDSPEVKACVAKKIPILVEEGMEQKQAVAVAFSMCRKDPGVAEKGKEVPEKHPSGGKERWLSDADLAQFGRDRLKAMTRPTVPDVSKAGTSEGAKLGWETRRGGGGSEQPRQEGASAALSDADSVIGLINEYRPKISNAESDYKMVLEEATERGERNPPKAAEGTLSELSGKVYSLLGQLRSKTSDAVKRGKDFIGANANPKERDDYEFRQQHAMNDVDEMTNVAHTARSIARRMAESGKSLDKAGTSEGAKLGWESRRGGGSAPEGETTKMPSRQEWDKFQSDSDDLFDVSRGAVKMIEQIEGHAMEEAAERRRFSIHPFGGKEPTTPKGVSQAMNKLEDIAPKAADLAARLKGVPGVDEGKRKVAEDKLRGWKIGFGREDMQDFHDTVIDLSNMVDDVRAEHDPMYMEQPEGPTHAAVGLGKALFPFWAKQGSKVGAPSEVKEIRPEYITEALSKGGTEDVVEGKKGKWVTMGGRAIFIEEGESPEDALSRHTGGEVDKPEGEKKEPEKKEPAKEPEKAPEKPEKPEPSTAGNAMQETGKKLRDSGDAFLSARGAAMTRGGDKPEVKARANEAAKKYVQDLDDAVASSKKAVEGLKGKLGVDEKVRSELEGKINQHESNMKDVKEDVKLYTEENNVGAMRFKVDGKDVAGLAQKIGEMQKKSDKVERGAKTRRERYLEEREAKRFAKPEGKEKSIGDILDEIRDNALSKEGTSEGAAKGWETRKGGAASIPMSSVSMETRKYVASQGKEPKGKGRWAFQIGDKTEFFDGEYRETKRKAVETAAERGERRVEVLP